MKLRVTLLLKTFLFIFFVFLHTNAQASSLDILKQFISKTQSAECEFTQVVYNKSNQVIQKSFGVFKINRPNQFYWEFKTPNQQIIINDSKKIWIYDPELKQVTSKPVQKLVGQTPASLLAGNNQIEQYFILKSIPSKDNLTWIEAIPKSTQDIQFEKMKLGFNKSVLRTIELYDHFGQKTLIEFNNFKFNIKYNSQQFIFSVPKGVDLIEE